MRLKNKLTLFYITSIFSMLVAVLGFSYNAWRMEITEDNSNIRTASFEVLSQLSEMEQMIFSAHYDKNLEEGNPRKVWIKVGLIVDLSFLISPRIEVAADDLKLIWREHWQRIVKDESAAKKVIAQIDLIRSEIKVELKGLQ